MPVYMQAGAHGEIVAHPKYQIAYLHVDQGCTSWLSNSPHDGWNPTAFQWAPENNMLDVQLSNDSEYYWSDGSSTGLLFTRLNL